MGDDHASHCSTASTEKGRRTVSPDNSNRSPPPPAEPDDWTMVLNKKSQARPNTSSQCNKKNSQPKSKPNKRSQSSRQQNETAPQGPHIAPPPPAPSMNASTFPSLRSSMQTSSDHPVQSSHASTDGNKASNKKLQFEHAGQSGHGTVDNRENPPSDQRRDSETPVLVGQRGSTLAVSRIHSLIYAPITRSKLYFPKRDISIAFQTVRDFDRNEEHKARFARQKQKEELARIYTAVNDYNRVWLMNEDPKPMLRCCVTGISLDTLIHAAHVFPVSERYCMAAGIWLRAIGLLSNDFKAAEERMKGTYLNICPIFNQFGTRMEFDDLGFMFLLSEECLIKLISVCESNIKEWSRNSDFSKFSPPDLLYGWKGYIKDGGGTTVNVYEYEMLLIQLDSARETLSRNIFSDIKGEERTLLTELWTWTRKVLVNEKQLLPHPFEQEIVKPYCRASPQQEGGPKLHLPIHPIISAVVSFTQLRSLLEKGRMVGEDLIKYEASEYLKTRMALLEYFLRLVQCPNPAYMWKLNRPQILTQRGVILEHIRKLDFKPSEICRKYYYDGSKCEASRVECMDVIKRAETIEADEAAAQAKRDGTQSRPQSISQSRSQSKSTYYRVIPGKSMPELEDDPRTWQLLVIGTPYEIKEGSIDSEAVPAESNESAPEYLYSLRTPKWLRYDEDSDSDSSDSPIANGNKFNESESAPPMREILQELARLCSQVWKTRMNQFALEEQWREMEDRISQTVPQGDLEDDNKKICEHVLCKKYIARLELYVSLIKECKTDHFDKRNETVGMFHFLDKLIHMTHDEDDYNHAWLTDEITSVKGATDKCPGSGKCAAIAGLFDYFRDDNKKLCCRYDVFFHLEQSRKIEYWSMQVANSAPLLSPDCPRFHYPGSQLMLKL